MTYDLTGQPGALVLRRDRVEIGPVAGLREATRRVAAELGHEVEWQPAHPSTGAAWVALEGC